jgi:hypothetical protein
MSVVERIDKYIKALEYLLDQPAISVDYDVKELKKALRKMKQARVYAEESDQIFMAAKLKR